MQLHCYLSKNIKYFLSLQIEWYFNIIANFKAYDNGILNIEAI